MDFNFGDLNIAKSPTEKPRWSVDKGEDESVTPAKPEHVDDGFPKPIKFTSFIKILNDLREGENRAVNSEAKIEDEIAETENNDLEVSVTPKKEDSEEKSDDEFQNMGFSEDDLEFLRNLKLQSGSPQSEESAQRGEVGGEPPHEYGQSET